MRYHRACYGNGKQSKYFFIHKHDNMDVVEYLLVVVLIKEEYEYRFS